MNVTLYIIIGILVAISGTLVYIIRNLMVKVEQYEDVTVDQTQYLQNISNIIGNLTNTYRISTKRGSFNQMMKLVNFLTK